MGLFDTVHYMGDAEYIPYLKSFCEEAVERLQISSPVVVTLWPMRKTFGLFTPKPRGMRNEIKISSYITGDLLELRETIFHEFCHAKTYENGSDEHHGPIWAKWMRFMGLAPEAYAPCRADNLEKVIRSTYRRYKQTV